MARISTDILISGGGVAGLTAAAAFGSAGFNVICVDPEPPVTSATATGADLRSTAFLQPAIEVLQAAGGTGRRRELLAERSGELASMEEAWERAAAQPSGPAAGSGSAA